MASNYGATSSNPQKPWNSATSSVARTKILFLGLRRAGKTSIQRFLFNNMPPNQTFFLETTMRITKQTIDSIIPLEIWDCPPTTTVESLGVPLVQFAAIIFVIDIRDLYNQPISKLVDVIVSAYVENPYITIEVFVHKAEKLQEDDKIENFRQIHERVSDRLLDLNADYEQMQLNFHLTSIYDNSLHEAFSRVLHKLTEPLPFLEELLNVFCANSQSSKAFLFDVNSKLYVATDSSPVDAMTHNLCCDYLTMLNSFMPLYKSATASGLRRRHLTGSDTPSPIRTAGSSGTNSSSSSTDHTSGPSSRDHSQSAVLARNASSGFLHPASPSSPTTPGATGYFDIQKQATPPPMTPSAETIKPQGVKFYPYSSTTTSLPSSTGSRGTTTITYHTITDSLALMALIPTAVFEERRGLVEVNVVHLREGVQDICGEEDDLRVG